MWRFVLASSHDLKSAAQKVVIVALHVHVVALNLRIELMPALKIFEIGTIVSFMGSVGPPLSWGHASYSFAGFFHSTEAVHSVGEDWVY